MNKLHTRRFMNGDSNIYDINGLLISKVNDGLGTKKEADDCADLIVSAVNSCIEINKDNPLAVAQSIKDIYESLKMMYKYAMIHPVEGVIYPEGSHKEWIKKAEQALAKVEGK